MKILQLDNWDKDQMDNGEYHISLKFPISSRFAEVGHNSLVRARVSALLQNPTENLFLFPFMQISRCFSKVLFTSSCSCQTKYQG